MRVLKTLCAFGSVTFISTGAQASLLAYEPFNYTAGANLLGQNGGSGFSGAYVHTDPFNPNSSYTIASAGLTYPNLQTSGRAVDAPAAGSPDNFNTIARPFTLPGGSNFGTTNGTLYASYLLRPSTAVVGSFGGVALTNNDSGSSNKPVFFGDSAGFYRLEEQGGLGATQSTGIASAANSTTLLVLKYTFATGNDTVRVFVNPTVGAAEPVSASATITLPTDFLRMELLDGSRAYQYDEFRLGTTYADVTPVIPTNTIHLSNFAGAVGTNLATGGILDVNGSGHNYVSEIDELIFNDNEGFVRVDDNLDQNAPVYVMLWTANDAVIPSLNITDGSMVTPGTDEWNDLQAYYGAAGIGGDNFNYLIKFSVNSFNIAHGAVNWNFAANPLVNIDRIAVVPEPSTMSLVAVTGLGLLGRRRRR